MGDSIRKSFVFNEVPLFEGALHGKVRHDGVFRIESNFQWIFPASGDPVLSLRRQPQFLLA